MKNDECEHGWRMMVELTIDVPLSRKITKRDLRKREYQILGAHWGKMQVYCKKCHFYKEIMTMYVLVNRKTGMYASGNPDLDTMQIWEKCISKAWVFPEFATAKRQTEEGWLECRVEQVPAQYVNSLQCAPMFEFMEEL